MYLRNYLTQISGICEQQCGYKNGSSSDVIIAQLLKYVYDGVDANENLCVFGSQKRV